MQKLKNCPLCGGETMLCKMQTGYTLCTDFSIVCLECGMEFKKCVSPTTNMAQYIYNPAKAAEEAIEAFNRRANVEIKEEHKNEN